MREWASARGEKRQRLEIRGESVHFLERPTGGAESGVGAADAEEGNLF